MTRIFMRLAMWRQHRHPREGSHRTPLSMRFAREKPPGGMPRPLSVPPIPKPFTYRNRGLAVTLGQVAGHRAGSPVHIHGAVGLVDGAQLSLAHEARRRGARCASWAIGQ